MDLVPDSFVIREAEMRLKKANKDYLVQDRPLKALLVFCLPMILGNLFQQFYTIADSAIVGRMVSELALAACGASYTLTMVIMCIAIGGGAGVSVIVSRYFGAKKYDKMKVAVWTAMISFLVFGVLLGAIMRIFSRPLLRLLDTPKDALDMAETYLNIYLYGLPFLFMYNVLNSMFNAIGKSRIPLYFLIFSSILNIGLDIYMVGPLEMEIAGAAWATFIAQGISAVLSFFVLIRTINNLHSKRVKMFDKKELWEIAKIGLPSIVQQSTVSLGMLFVQVVVNRFGSEALAGYTAAVRISSIFMVPMNVMGNAVSAYTAQNIGAQKLERVTQGLKIACAIVMVAAVAICAALEIFSHSFMVMFMGSDGTEMAYKTGEGYLTFMGIFYFVLGLKQSVDGLLRGAGDMTIFTAANVVNLILRVGLAFGLAPVFGVAMAWYCVPVGWIVNLIMSYLELRTGKWRKIYDAKLLSKA